MSPRPPRPWRSFAPRPPSSSFAPSNGTRTRRAQAERLAHEQVLREIDDAAAAELKAEEERLDREIAQQEATERKAQAEAVAKALRRP